MAVADPLFIQRAPLTHGPSFQTEPFDIDLLCAKLEVAKLEQDAARARQRLRQLTNNNASQNTRQHDPPTKPQTWASSTHSTEKAHPRFSPNARNAVHPKQLLTAVSLGRSDSGQSQNTSDYPVQSPTKDGRDEYHSHRSSHDTQEYNASPPQHQRMPKRKPVARTTDPDVNSHHSNQSSHNTTQRQSIIERPLSREMSNRRSKTFPLQQGCKLPLKHHSMTTTYEWTEATEEQPPQHTSYRSPPKPMRAATTNSYSPPESPMGLVNEYTISFDLADYETEDYSTPSKHPRHSPQQPDALRSKSLLSLPLLMKRDKTQVKTEEVVVLSPQEQSPISPLRPSTAANQAWHSRQQSLPLDFGHEGAMQRPKWMMEGQQQSKRRSFVGWLKKL